MDYDSMSRDELIRTARQLEGTIAHQDKVLEDQNKMIAVMRKSRVVPKPDKSQSERIAFPPKVTSIPTATTPVTAPIPTTPEAPIVSAQEATAAVQNVVVDEVGPVEEICRSGKYGDEPTTAADLMAILSDINKEKILTTQSKDPPEIVFNYVETKDYRPEPNSDQGGDEYDDIVCANNLAYYNECRRKYPQFYGGEVTLWDRLKGRVKGWWDDFRHKSEEVPDYDDEEAG